MLLLLTGQLLCVILLSLSQAGSCFVSCLHFLDPLNGVATLDGVYNNSLLSIIRKFNNYSVFK